MKTYFSKTGSPCFVHEKDPLSTCRACVLTEKKKKTNKKVNKLINYTIDNL